MVSFTADSPTLPPTPAFEEMTSLSLAVRPRVKVDVSQRSAIVTDAGERANHHDVLLDRQTRRFRRPRHHILSRRVRDTPATPHHRRVAVPTIEKRIVCIGPPNQHRQDVARFERRSRHLPTVTEWSGRQGTAHPRGECRCGQPSPSHGVLSDSSVSSRDNRGIQEPYSTEFEGVVLEIPWGNILGSIITLLCPVLSALGPCWRALPTRVSQIGGQRARTIASSLGAQLKPLAVAQPVRRRTPTTKVVSYRLARAMVYAASSTWTTHTNATAAFTIFPPTRMRINVPSVQNA